MSASIVAVVICLSAIRMPTSRATDCRSTIAPSVADMPLGYISVKRSGSPPGMPAPHSPEPVPERWQVVVPLGTTFQPWAPRIRPAASTLNGYGFTRACAFGVRI